MNQDGGKLLQRVNKGDIGNTCLALAMVIESCERLISRSMTDAGEVHIFFAQREESRREKAFKVLLSLAKKVADADIWTIGV